MAFMHGAQDGQKFIGVFLLGMAFSSGQAEMGTVEIPDLADGCCAPSSWASAPPSAD